MIKSFCVFVLGLSLFFGITNAEALVARSASTAMSYKNTVRRPSSKSVSTVRKEKKPEVLPYKSRSVDMQRGTSKTVALTELEELEITIKEKEGFTWKVSYDSDNLIMIGNSAEGDVRTIKFKQRNSADSTVFLDRRNAKGETVENKAVYIKVR